MDSGAMTYPGFRSGTFAVVNGRERSCSYIFQTKTVTFFTRAAENPDPAIYTWYDRGKGWLAELPASQFDRVYAVSTFVSYYGYRCEVVEFKDDGTAELRYSDWNGAWAGMQGGFEQREKYEFYKVVPVSELYDYHEEQRDLVFDDWREQNFARPAETTS
jgi:hypothetical protein